MNPGKSMTPAEAYHAGAAIPGPDPQPGPLEERWCHLRGHQTVGVRRITMFGQECGACSACLAEIIPMFGRAWNRHLKTASNARRRDRAAA